MPRWSRRSAALVDERASPEARPIGAGASRIFSRPRSAAAPARTTRRARSPSRSCAMRWSPPSTRLGAKATPEAVLSLEGARSRLRLGRLPGRGLPPARCAGWSRPGTCTGAEKPTIPPDEDEATPCPPARRAEMPLRRRPQPDGGRPRAPVAVARDAGPRS